MTSAPPVLLDVRRLLLEHLGGHGLASAEVGIVGDTAHRGGYHCGADRLDPTRDYSVVESPRDKSGLTLDASALDVGTFSVTAGGRTHTLATFSTWLAGQCDANAPDTRDIREVIYSPDGRTVRRWDRLGRRSSGDDSHLYHTHVSYFRDAIRAGRAQTPVFRRYLAIIGLIEVPDMTPEQDARLTRIETALMRLDGRESIGRAYLRLAVGQDHMPDATPVDHPTLTSIAGQLSALTAAVSTLAGRDFTDEAAIVAAVLAGLDPTRMAEAVAAAVPPEIAGQVADILAARLAA